MHLAKHSASASAIALTVIILARPTPSQSNVYPAPSLVEIRPNPPVVGYPVRITLHHPLLDVSAGQLQWRYTDSSHWHTMIGCQLTLSEVSEKPLHLEFRLRDSQGRLSAPLEIYRTPVRPTPQLWVISTEPAEGPTFGQPFRINLVAQSPLSRPVQLEWRRAGQTTWQGLAQPALTLNEVSTLQLQLEFRARDADGLASPPLRQSWSVNPLMRSYPVARRAGLASNVPLHALALVPRTDAVLVGGDRGFLALLDLTTGQAYLLTGHHPEKTVWNVAAVRTSRDELLGLSASDDGTAILWDLRKRAPRTVFQDHLGAVTAVAFSPDGLFAFTGGRDGLCLMRDTETGKIVQKMQVGPNAICALRSWSGGDNIFLAVGHSAGFFSIWDARAGKALAYQVADVEQVWALAISCDLRLLTIGRLPYVRHWRYLDNKIQHVFDLTPQPLPQELRWHVQQLFTGVAFTPDGQYALACDTAGRLTLWRTDNGSLLHTFSLPAGNAADSSFGFSAVEIRPDGQSAITADRQGFVRLWFIGERP
ncbi:MAG: hypothetical protein RMI91_14825 [Gemmatales bacterium]|nr:hypothetical protein [Gemmatales bacterium]MDW7995918.1 hypothetical protein [Gemmatales bacterium]